jgi:hypothetical protein
MLFTSRNIRYGHAVQMWETRNVNRSLWEIFENNRLEDGKEGRKVNKVAQDRVY